MHKLLSYQRAKNADGQTDRQTAFQLYIIEYIYIYAVEIALYVPTFAKSVFNGKSNL